MRWARMRRGMLVANLGADRGVVERTEDDRTWSARRSARSGVSLGVRRATMTEAQVWVERKIETLQSPTPPHNNTTFFLPPPESHPSA